MAIFVILTDLGIEPSLSRQKTVMSTLDNMGGGSILPDFLGVYVNTLLHIILKTKRNLRINLFHQ